MCFAGEELEVLAQEGCIFGLPLVAVRRHTGAVFGMCLQVGRLVQETCDFLVKIPMRGRLNSLNASTAAGVMIYVVVEELIPEMSEGKHSNAGTVAFALVFVLMMVLDVALG